MTQEKSVTITTHERESLAVNVHQNFMKVAKSRHPGLDFVNRLAVEVTAKAYSEIEEYMDTPVAKHLAYENRKSYVADALGYMLLPEEVFIYRLSESRFSPMLDKVHRIHFDDPDNVMIPDKFIVNNNYVNPFCRPGDAKLELSEEMLLRINKFNEKMEQAYVDLSAARDAILNTIDNSKTTKMLYAATTELNSLFPPSLKAKIKRKNEAEEIEQTEEQKLINSATNYIATATLLGD